MTPQGERYLQRDSVSVVSPGACYASDVAGDMVGTGVGTGGGPFKGCSPPLVLRPQGRWPYSRSPEREGAGLDGGVLPVCGGGQGAGGATLLARGRIGPL